MLIAALPRPQLAAQAPAPAPVPMPDSSLLSSVPTSVLLQQCMLNHNRLQAGLPAVPLAQVPQAPAPVPVSQPHIITLPANVASLLLQQQQQQLPVSLPTSTVASALPVVTQKPLSSDVFELLRAGLFR